MAAPAWATQANAQKYYNTLTPEQRQGVPMNNLVEWFTNAVNAGVPDAVAATGASRGVADQNQGYTGSYMDFSGAADAAEWYGKRKPTPAELRKWAADQHARYVSGDRSAQDEDYERFDDRTLAGWINENWDVQRGGFFSPNGERIGKPPDVDSTGVNAYGETVGGGGTGGGKSASTPGVDPLQQRLLEMFVGGEGAFNTNRAVGQSLQGGGVWWSGTDEDKADARQPAARPGAGNQSFGGVAAPLANALLTSFGPNPPSAQAGAAPPVTGAPTSVPTGPGQMPTFNSAWNPSTSGVAAPQPQAQPVKPTPPATGGSELEQAVQKRFTRPGAWWSGPQQRTA